MRSSKGLLVTLTSLVGVTAACGGTTHQSTQQNQVDQTPAYQKGYKIGYNAVLGDFAENCQPRAVALRKSGRLKTKVEVHEFVAGCNTGATDAVRTK